MLTWLGSADHSVGQFAMQMPEVSFMAMTKNVVGATCFRLHSDVYNDI